MRKYDGRDGEAEEAHSHLKLLRYLAIRDIGVFALADHLNAFFSEIAIKTGQGKAGPVYINTGETSIESIGPGCQCEPEFRTTDKLIYGYSGFRAHP